MTTRDDDPPADGQGDRQGREYSRSESGRVDQSRTGQEQTRTTTYQQRRQEEVRTEPPKSRTDDPEDDGPSELVLFGRDVVVSILAVILIGGYIFMISGVWPPMVAIESGSMEPNMDENDLVFVMDTDRFQPGAAQTGTGVVTAEDGERAGYEQFGASGDVVVFHPQGDENPTPIIHRVMFWVEEGEDWTEHEAVNEAYLGNRDSCDDFAGCPAPHDGFITKGDRNPTYDQTGNGQLDPVKPEWVVGTAEYRLPYVGWLRLQF